ncbi:hypothetical protein Cgig2_028093 [Carnegiea gigantea]|uniref:Uncharacterized protein n=1 Tax=Carnegiea gigantea TaxID=171969 RepID=A0A9Q1KK78_9CARY|nr:hypothetical protein Cgig2_028093 [Carnegiea gigantea]
MASPKEPTTPPPVIGKIGPYTVFLTPPSPTTTEPQPSLIPQTPKKVAVQTPPPVKPPPLQFDKPPVDRFGIFRDALAKVQNVHATVDEFMANWLGLNQSKFQWALDDYYEAKGVDLIPIALSTYGNCATGLVGRQSRRGNLNLYFDDDDDDDDNNNNSKRKTKDRPFSSPPGLPQHFRCPIIIATKVPTSVNCAPHAL